MNAYTAGPWRVEPDVEMGYARVRAKNGREVLFWAHLPDAKLCAAAPDLLAAAQVILYDEAISSWLHDHDPKALDQIKKAIAAALLEQETDQ